MIDKVKDNIFKNLSIIFTEICIIERQKIIELDIFDL